MSDEWEEPDWRDDWRTDWRTDEPEAPAMSFGDPEAWRGDLYDPLAEEAAWRGDVHLHEWPVWNAGPEYHMWKKRAEGEGEEER